MEDKERKLYKIAVYIHDLWYTYKDSAREEGKEPTADGFFDWLEGYVL